MTNISKVKLPPEVRKKLVSQMAGLFSRVSPKLATNLFSDLLTETEEIMLTKRLAVIVMLSEGHTTYKIANTLHVSDVTVASIRSHLYEGDYNQIVKVISNKKFDSEKFWTTFEIILRGGMPSMSHKTRWKSV